MGCKNFTRSREPISWPTARIPGRALLRDACYSFGKAPVGRSFTSSQASIKKSCCSSIFLHFRLRSSSFFRFSTLVIFSSFLSCLIVPFILFCHWLSHSGSEQDACVKAILMLMVCYLPVPQARTGFVEPTAAARHWVPLLQERSLPNGWKCLFRLLWQAVLTHLSLPGVIWLY